jgi:hypothetical protein
MIPWLEVETRAGEPIRVGRTRLIPFAQSVRLNLPASTGGVVWSRPTAVLAQLPDGQEVVLPIKDITQQAQLTLLAIGLIGAMLIWLLNRKNN